MAADGSILVAANNKGNYYVWKTQTTGDLTQLEALTKVAGHNKYITKCLLSPDTKYVFHLARYLIVKLSLFWDSS